MALALDPRPLPSVLLLSLVPVAFWFIVRPLLDPPPPLPALLTSVGFSIFAFLAALIPHTGTWTILYPRVRGWFAPAIYILLLILFIPFSFSNTIANLPTKGTPLEGLLGAASLHHELSVYLSSLLSLLISTLLGFLDDVFDIRWRHKLPIPLIAAIPLLMVYYAEGGNTHVVVPIPLRPLFGVLVNLVSQALIIGISVILNDLLYLPWPIDFRIPLHLLGSQAEVEVGGPWHAGMAYGSSQLVSRHLFSLYFMLPLVGVCLGFMYHNWYPARAFPGDTLCYVTGMAFSVVGIQGHFSKTLLLFFIPQIFNFVLSCPQIFGLVPCPRHRVPRFDPDTNLLHPSTAQFSQPPSRLTTLILRAFASLRLTRLKFHSSNGTIIEATNLTILNFLLVNLGPMNEKRLVQTLMAVQVSGSVLAFAVRYGLAGLLYDGDRH
ncbi:hypothetical protein F5141DRAFT_1104313 [Pisolithus sp. B1]|nr:hypothetical protein F5141DRAFT_1104313 [Pisolithus sp. B1]